MGHHISAIIGKDKVDIEKIKELGLATAFESGYVIILFDLYSMCKLGEILNKSTDSNSENIEWNCELTHFLAKQIGLRKFALIETDYFAGIGDQYATYFNNGVKVLNDVSINEALRELGVEKKNNLDEFATINLGKYRNSQYFYWETNNPADKYENMIAGRILNN